jgi:hypothetical protein
MMNTKKNHFVEEKDRNQAPETLHFDCNQSCCSPEFTEGCIECGPCDNPDS